MINLQFAQRAFASAVAVGILWGIVTYPVHCQITYQGFFTASDSTISQYVFSTPTDTVAVYVNGPLADSITVEFIRFATPDSLTYFGTGHIDQAFISRSSYEELKKLGLEWLQNLWVFIVIEDRPKQ
jgi:hypothetical protein